MEKLKEFMEFLRNDPKAADLFGDKEKPKDFKELAHLYAEAAEKSGFSLTEEEIYEGIQALANEQKAKTEQIKETLDELDMGQLEAVAGGGDHANCKYSYQQRENCWFTDGCDFMNMKYDGYVCHNTDWSGYWCEKDYFDKYGCDYIDKKIN